ncbi:MAG: hypothetical protein RL266_1690 [Bacteroidota bacterium]|jgi:hypothetical protein
MKHWGFFLIALLPVWLLAQTPHPILRSFSAVKQPNGVFLKWVIKGGQQCQGTHVFRAGDDFLFEQINHIDGICGSTTGDETYTYFDNEPFSNAYNHYRLELGFQGFTDTVTVFFEDFGAAAFLLQSDQALQTHRVLFSNDNNAVAEITVFDHAGNRLTTFEVLGSDAVISTSGWRPGIYLFSIAGVSRSDIAGKFYVALP